MKHILKYLLTCDNCALRMDEEGKPVWLHDEVREAQQLLADSHEVMGWLMEGIGNISVPDYAKLNDTMAKLAAEVE